MGWKQRQCFEVIYCPSVLIAPPLHCLYFHFDTFPARGTCLCKHCFRTHTYTICNTHPKCCTQSVLSRSMPEVQSSPNCEAQGRFSRAVRCQEERSYCSSLVTHSQTQRFCRLESHFLLGEVSHCNKARRGSQGRVSTPGWGKWSVPNHSSFFSAVKI